MAQESRFEQEDLALKKELIRVQYMLKDFERRSGFFEMLIKSLPGIFYLVDESLEFRRWNENLEKVTGYSSAELKGMSSLQMFEGEDARKIREGLRRENVNLRSSIKDRYRLGRIIGKSPAMQEVYELILNAAATSAEDPVPSGRHDTDLYES